MKTANEMARENTAAKLEKLATFIKTAKCPTSWLLRNAAGLQGFLDGLKEWTDERKDLDTIPDKDLKDIDEMWKQDIRLLRVYIDKITINAEIISEALDEIEK